MNKAILKLLSSEYYKDMGLLETDRSEFTLDAPARVRPAVSSSSNLWANLEVASACCSGVPLAAATTSLPTTFRAAAAALRLFWRVR